MTKEIAENRISEILNRRRKATSNDEVYDEWKKFIKNRG